MAAFGLREIAVACCLGLAPVSVAADTSAEREADALTYATAVEAAVYGLPLEGMMLRLSSEVLDPKTRKADFNQYFHYTSLATPEVSPFRAPNNDTLYSTAWLDLRGAPLILDMPDTVGRYYTAQIMDLTTDTIANIGQRLNGTQSGSFAIVGPNWKGELPGNVKQTIKCDTIFAAVLLRILVDGPADVANVNALQNKFGIRPLQKAQDQMPELQPFEAKTPVARFQLLDKTLHLNPVRAGEEGVMGIFAGIELGPAKAIQRRRPSPEILDRAYANANTVIKAAGLRMGEYVNGWRLLRDGMGRYGFDYLQRAAVWAGGPLANVIEESFYPTAVTDSAGQPLDGVNAYKIQFKKGALPPVRAFWSLTMYDMRTGNLIANPISRYSIGNRTRGLAYAPDGSLTLYVQSSEPPNAAERANWLPSPKTPFYMVLRLYGPEPEAISGQWLPPPIVKLTSQRN